MGNLCNLKEIQYNLPENQKKIKKQAAENSKYAEVIKEYMNHYGKKPDEATKKFIDDNYHPNYDSTTIRLGD